MHDDMVGIVQHDKFTDHRGVTFQFELNHQEETFKVSRLGSLSGKLNTLSFSYADASRLKEWLTLSVEWQELIQVTFPHFSTEQREFIITGTTDEEWTSMFGNEDE